LIPDQLYGQVKFLGETDVRRLDLESIIQFNKCEVLVYMDENKKPAIGQGLNKPAEVTLLNVKYMDKKTGQYHSEVERFEKRLKKKTEEQGAEFISYNGLKGEWKFRVKHFSRYGLDFDSDEEDATVRNQEKALTLAGW
jgi:nuclear pore complex protein Nup98-Nup96